MDQSGLFYSYRGPYWAGAHISLTTRPHRMSTYQYLTPGYQLRH